MHPAEIEKCLESMTILVDTREHPNEEMKRRCEAFGCDWNRQALDYGDYTYNFIKPDGKPLFELSETSVIPDVAIERKQSLTELSGNLTKGRDRFRREWERAKEMYLLVEDGSWEKILAGRYKTKFHPNAYFSTLASWMARYNIRVIFCNKMTSGIMIKSILQKELKKRLEDGFYG